MSKCESLSVELQIDFYKSVENHISQGNYCILALQSLSVEKQKLPKLYNYYYPLLYHCNQTTGKVQTAVCIRSDLEYTSLTTSPPTNVTGDVYTSGAEVKINEHTTLNVISIYLSNGPKGDNTDWLNTLHCQIKNG